MCTKQHIEMDTDSDDMDWFPDRHGIRRVTL
jgi:hypothetical protein